MSTFPIAVLAKSVKYAIDHPTGTFAVTIGVAAIIAAVAGLVWAIKMRPIPWEHMYHELSDRNAAQLEALGLVATLAERVEALLADREVSQTEIDDYLVYVLTMAARRREIEHYNYLNYHLDDVAIHRLIRSGRVTEENISSFSEAPATPADLRKRMNDALSAIRLIETGIFQTVEV